MSAEVAIGEFSRLTHLSVKTLHHYHDVGLLEPASVDRSTGYRRYSLDQVSSAHLIRRLRDLDMPVPRVQALLSAPDVATRDTVLRHHLQQMEAELARTRVVVASLRELLEPAPPLDVEIRTVPRQLVLAMSDIVSLEGVPEWGSAAFERLGEAADRHGIPVTGAVGATYTRAFFEEDAGEVVAFVPVAVGTGPVPGLELRELAEGRFAVAVHAGPYDDFDRTYGALGTHVAEHGLTRPDTVDEPIRELYIVGPGESDDPADYRTDVLWPIRTDIN